MLKKTLLISLSKINETSSCEYENYIRNLGSNDYSLRTNLVMVIFHLNISLYFWSFIIHHLARARVFIIDHVLLGVVDAAAPEHEPVHAHAQVLTWSRENYYQQETEIWQTFSLETLPDKHTSSRHSGHLAWSRRDLVSTWNKTFYTELALACKDS